MAEKDYWSLSGGQRQRALVARALVRRPRILFLDEPTKGLDLAAEDALMQSLTDLNRRESLTVLFITHDLTLAARYASHVALFHNGKVEGGSIADAMNPERLLSTYGVPIAVSQETAGKVTVSMGRGTDNQ
jgi:ABC-type cobalamin/Fe3+-siderophores transport system ATPase subunit